MYTQLCITLINPIQDPRSWFRYNRFNTKKDWYGICSVTKEETSIWMDISVKGFSVQNYSKKNQSRQTYSDARDRIKISSINQFYLNIHGRSSTIIKKKVRSLEQETFYICHLWFITKPFWIYFEKSALFLLVVVVVQTPLVNVHDNK